MSYTKTAIKYGPSSLTSSVVEATNASSFTFNLVESNATTSHAFATFSGIDNTLTLKKSNNTKGTIVADVSAEDVTTNNVTVTDTLTLSKSVGAISFTGSGTSTISSTGTGVQLESVLFNGAEISNADLVLSGSNSIQLNSSTVIIGDGTSTGGGQILSSTENGVGVLTIDPSPDDHSGVLVIKGDLQVKGTTTTVDSTTISMGDAILQLNGGNTAQDAGLEVNRQGSTAVYFVWKEAEQYWSADTNSIHTTGGFLGDVTGTVSSLSNHTTDVLTEGSTNLYYTLDRVNTAFDNRLALKTTDDLTEGSNLYYTDTRFNNAFSLKNTDNLSEGSTNLYYTDTRVRSALSVTDTGGDGSLSYDSSTGVVTYTGPSATEVRAHFSGGTGVSVTDGTIAIGQSVATTDSVTFNTVTANLVGDVTGTVSSLSNHTTDVLTEGSSNLYYTDTRVRSALSVTDTGGDGSLSYDSGNGVVTYTGPSASETRAHFSAGNGIDINSGQISLGTSLLKTSVTAVTTYTENLLTLLTGVNSPFTNTAAGGAVTLYVACGDISTYNVLCMGVYHAVLVASSLHIVSQLEVNDPNGLIRINLNNNDLVINNTHSSQVSLSIRAVMQHDNSIHLA